MAITVAAISSIVALALLAIRGIVRSLEPAAQAWLAEEGRRASGPDVLSRGIRSMGGAERAGTAPARVQAVAAG